MNVKTTLCTVLLLSTPFTVAQTGSNTPAYNLQAAPDMPLANTSRDTVSFSWAADGAPRTSESHVATSREYRSAINSGALRRGVSFNTTAPGAVISISPASAGKRTALNVLDVQVKTPGGALLRGSDAMDQLVDQRAIQATGVPFSNGMVGFRLKEGLGSGEFTLQLPSASGQENYTMHVLDRNSKVTLSLTAPAQTLIGNQFRAQGELAQGEIDTASATLISPQGQRTAVPVSLRDGHFQIDTSANRATSYDSGLWELHVTAMSHSGTQRDVKTAFAVAHPTARIATISDRAASRYQVAIETASAGRYEVGATLFGTGKNGPVPVANAATAAWLEAGEGMIELAFDQALFDAAAAKAPYTLRYVTLKDQSRMSVLQSGQ